MDADTGASPASETAQHFARASERLRGDPLFPKARIVFLEALLPLYEGHRFLTRMLVEAGRSVVFFNLVTLDAASDPADRETWPTMKLLKSVVAPYGVTSERRLHDIVRRLISVNYVISTPATADQRVRLLTPSAAMLEHHRDWLRAFYAPLQAMKADPAYEPAMARDVGFQRAYLQTARQWSGYAAELMAGNPAMSFFMTREAGAVILMKLIALNLQGHSPRRGGVPFELADAFGVSRTHLRNLVTDAERRGLLASTDAGVRVLAPAAEAFDRFLSDCMIGNDHICRAIRQSSEAAD